VNKRNRPDKDGADRTVFNYYKARLKAMQPPCAICGLPINYDLPYTSPWSFTVDHIVPISRGGTTTEENVQAAHRKCNRAKGSKLFLSPEEVKQLRSEQGVRAQADYSNGTDNEATDIGTQPQFIFPQSADWRKD
jgi:5-methylcytosine-specific restriction endonuclease McrA